MGDGATGRLSALIIKFAPEDCAARNNDAAIHLLVYSRTE